MEKNAYEIRLNVLQTAIDAVFRRYEAQRANATTTEQIAALHSKIPTIKDVLDTTKEFYGFVKDRSA